VKSCSWSFQRDDVVVELYYEPSPVLIDYEQLPPVHERGVPALEWAARNQELDVDRPFLGSEPRCSPDYMLRITTPKLDFAHFGAPISGGGPKDRRFRDEAHGLFDR